MIQVRVGVRDFKLADHAVERYRERVRPRFSLDEALAELRQRLRHAEVHLTRPVWARSYTMRSGSLPDEYVAIEDGGLLFPVRRGRIGTCLVPGHVGATVRWVA